MIKLSSGTKEMLEIINGYDKVRSTYLETIKSLLLAIDIKDAYTKGHSSRVYKYTKLICEELKISEEEKEDICVASILHDIGKMGIESSILSKPGKLTEEEFEIVKMHPIIGYNLLQSFGFNNTITDIVKFHHKKHDNSGYPSDNPTHPLPLGVSIIGATDALDAMTTNRPYRKALDFNYAIFELQKHSGTQFNPYVVDLISSICSKNIDVFELIAEDYDVFLK